MFLCCCQVFGSVLVSVGHWVGLKGYLGVGQCVLVGVNACGVMLLKLVGNVCEFGFGLWQWFVGSVVVFNGVRVRRGIEVCRCLDRGICPWFVSVAW